MAELADALRASVSPFRLPERSAPVIEDEHEVALGAASRGAAL
jgi:hypothetical protein